jgi:hypothetical protein
LPTHEGGGFALGVDARTFPRDALRRCTRQPNLRASLAGLS